MKGQIETIQDLADLAKAGYAFAFNAGFDANHLNFTISKNLVNVQMSASVTIRDGTPLTPLLEAINRHKAEFDKALRGHLEADGPEK